MIYDLSDLDRADPPPPRVPPQCLPLLRHLRAAQRGAPIPQAVTPGMRLARDRGLVRWTGGPHGCWVLSEAGEFAVAIREVDA